MGDRARKTRACCTIISLRAGDCARKTRAYNYTFCTFYTGRAGAQSMALRIAVARSGVWNS